MKGPPFYVERAISGRAACKECKQRCEFGELRMAKMVDSPYKEGEMMKSWYHIDCLMTVFLKQRPTTKRIDSVSEIGNWNNISIEDQTVIIDKINEMETYYANKHGHKVQKVLKNEIVIEPEQTDDSDNDETAENHKGSSDDRFEEFIKICERIANVDAYTDKTSIVNNFFQKGTDKQKFTGDIKLWCKLLLPQAVKRVYNLKSRQLIKLFSRILDTDHDDMSTHLEQGDVADTIERFFYISLKYRSAAKSTLTMQEVDEFLEKLSNLTREDEQIYHFKTILRKCTSDDLRMLIRLIKGDLRINAGPKHILEGVHPDAYNVFQTSRDIDMVMSRVLPESSGVKSKNSTQQTVQAQITLMTPVLPMLAEACKSVEMAMKKCPNGMFAEIKYDGERVQVHKMGKVFRYFSRALKPVMPHKVDHFRNFLPKAFPEAEDLILDAEVLMIDLITGKPLPFGTLGVHKKNEFAHAEVCLFVFDCLYYNGKNLMDTPIRERRKVLQEHMIEIRNHVMFSEQQVIRRPQDLAKIIAEVLKQNLEGLVLKDLNSKYEPGKRHWLKVKKDYLFDGAMADTADLVVLGAWFGTGKKGGMMSVFLMGCYDEKKKQWCTVTKVHTGHDDKTLEKLQNELGQLMVKISQDHKRIPQWFNCTKAMAPDFVAKDPKNQPVWEITGTEFTKANIHTADGISVRFPRVTRIRDDKTWETATTLEELKHLYNTSKQSTDVSLLNKLAETAKKIGGEISTPSTSTNGPGSSSEEPPKKKQKTSPAKTKSIDSYFIKKPSKNSVDCITNESSMEVDNSRRLSGSSTTDKSADSPKKNVSDSSPRGKENKMKIQLYPENPLPDAFKDKKVAFYPDFISFPEQERRHFERHWIAYGGKVVKSLYLSDVDYVVHKDKSIQMENIKKMRNLNKSARHVTSHWIITCINEKKLVDTKPFSVKLLP